MHYNSRYNGSGDMWLVMMVVMLVTAIIGAIGAAVQKGKHA